MMVFKLSLWRYFRGGWKTCEFMSSQLCPLCMHDYATVGQVNSSESLGEVLERGAPNVTAPETNARDRMSIMLVTFPERWQRRSEAAGR